LPNRQNRRVTSHLGTTMLLWMFSSRVTNAYCSIQENQGIKKEIIVLLEMSNFAEYLLMM
jgi:hypothetical protein